MNLALFAGIAANSSHLPKRRLPISLTGGSIYKSEATRPSICGRNWGRLWCFLLDAKLGGREDGRYRQPRNVAGSVRRVNWGNKDYRDTNADRASRLEGRRRR